MIAVSRKRERDFAPTETGFRSRLARAGSGDGLTKRAFGAHVLDSSTDRLVSPANYSNQQIAIKLAIVIYIDRSIAYAALLK